MPREPLRGTVFAEVAVERMSDADALLRERRYNGAIYMAGYAVECALKAALCRHQVETWLTVDEQSHDLSAYAARMGLQHTIQTQPAMR